MTIMTIMTITDEIRLEILNKLRNKDKLEEKDRNYYQYPCKVQKVMKTVEVFEPCDD